jgi:hypothetical protein
VAALARYVAGLFDPSSDVSGIAMAIGCASQWSRSTAGGDLLSIRIKDDAGVYPQFDWQIGCAGSEPGLQGTWIHLLMSVHPTSIRVYADGVEQTMFGFPRSWNEAGGASITNPAYPNPARLSEHLGAISLEGTASIGSFQGDLAAQEFHAGYTGRMAWVQVFTKAISEADSMCLFSVDDLVQGCPEDMPASSLDLSLTAASPSVTLRGNAAFHEEFGIAFDGDGDWAEVAAPADYTTDKSFTINFWASQTLCKIPGLYEPLFIHATNTTGMTQEEADIASSISVFAVCFGDSPALVAEVISKNQSPGAGPRAGVLASGSGMIPSGGWETANWMSIGLSVSPTSLAMYVDGIEVTSTGRWGWQGEAGSADDLAGTNQANPDAGNFATPLESFYGLPDSIMLGGLMADDVTVFFEGSIQALTIFDDALDMYAHDCLFQVLETEVATCADPGQPTWSRSGRVNNYYASFLDASVPDGTTLMGDVFQNGAFGLSFDGDEDYLQITGDTRDFATDGTFAVAFWFTKPVCNVPGRWEFVFSQLEDESMPVTWGANSGVDMFIGCGERFQVSSIGGDILRTVLVDARRDLAMFDVQIDYFGDGIMTDTWVHVVMNVHRSNGCGGNGRDAGRRQMQAEVAADVCTGPTPPPPPRTGFERRDDGSEVCDMGGAEVFINGQMLPREAMGYPCDPQNPCDASRPGFEQVFSEGPASRIPSQWQQQIEVMAAGGDDPRAMIPMLLGSGALGADGTAQRPGRPSAAGGDQQPTATQNGRGDRGSTGGRGGRGSGGNSTVGGRGGGRQPTGARAINVAVPDPTNFSRPLRGFDAADVYRDNRVFEHALDKGGYTPDDGDDGEPTGHGLAAGVTHVFHAMTGGGWGRSNGWNGGYWEIVNAAGDVVAGGPVDGLVTDSGGDFEFTIEDPTDYSSDSRAGCPCAQPCSNIHMRRGRERTGDMWYCSILDEDTCDMDGTFRGNRLCLIEGLTVRIVTRTSASGISWSIDDGSMYSGPIKSNIYVGGRAGGSDDHYFIGSLAGLTINSRPLDKHEVECMYLAGEESMGQCDDPASVGFYSTLRRRRGDDDVNLHGHTYLDRDMGAVMDGQRDYVTFTDAGFMERDFTISFWFQKRTACENPGRWEFLYSESVNDGDFWSSDSAAVEVVLACSRDDDNGGDVVRTWLKDNDGQNAVFDINVDDIRDGGPVTGQWVHYLLAVNRRSLRLYIDGTPTGLSDAPPFSDSGTVQQTYSFPRWFSDPERNLAYPNPEQLNGRLRGFDGLSEIYSSWRDEAVALDGLAPGTTYTMNFGNGADAGGWFMVNYTVVNEVAESCLATDHDAAQCMETPNGSHETHENMMNISGTMYEYDSDCCAMMGTGACAPGYSYVQGTPGCGRDWMAIASTWCVPDTTDPLPNCTYTAGDASSCGAGCTYTAPVTGVYPGLLVQELSGTPGTATFTTPDAPACMSDAPPCEGEALGPAWQPGGIFMTMHTPSEGWEAQDRIAAELVWSIDDTELSGPNTGNVYLGASSGVRDGTFYMGSMANAMVQTNDIDDTEAFCVFQSGQSSLDVCDLSPENVKVDLLGGRNLDSQPRWGVTLGGEAHLEDDYGVTLDGMGDYLKLESDDLDYAMSGEFSLAFWFTKAVCRNIGDYEILYSHHADPDGWSGCRHGPDGKCSECNAGIQVSLGCFSDGTDDWSASSTISGDVIRVELTDTQCNTAVFDTPLLKAGGGYVTDAWVHFALSTWGSGAHVYIDGESIDSAECRPARGTDWRANRERCGDAMTTDDHPADACAAVLADDGQPACRYRDGEHGFPVSEGVAARWWSWATTPANVAYPSPRHFQSEMGPYLLWQEPRAGWPMQMNVTLDMGRHIFKPGCRGCRYSRTGWGDAFWMVSGPDGVGMVAGGPQGGRVSTRTGSDVCETNRDGFSRFSQEDCLAAEGGCCRWDPNADLGEAGADTDGDGVADAIQGSGGQCVSGVGDGSCAVVPGINWQVEDGNWRVFDLWPEGHDASKCMETPNESHQLHDANLTDVGGVMMEHDPDCCAGVGGGGCEEGYTYVQGGQCWWPDNGSPGPVTSFCVPDGSSPAMTAEVTVTVMVPRSMDNSWVVEWMIDDGGTGMQGPVRGPLFLGQPNDSEDGWTTAGYAGSIAGVKTWSGSLRPNEAKCIFLEAETSVGICESVDGVIYEAEFTAGGQAGNDPERDLNGPVQSRVDTIQECSEICEDFRYFGMQWGSSCQCGNDYGQHGPAPATPDGEWYGECSWPCRGNHDDSCRATDEYTCSAVTLDGTEATCTDAGACAYTAASDTIIEAATCTSLEVTMPAEGRGRPTTMSTADYCAVMNATQMDSEWIAVQCSAPGAPDYGVPGGCQLSADMTSCSAITSEAACNALVDDETACAAEPYCTYTAAVTQPETCVATDKAACEGAAVNDDEAEIGDDLDADEDRATCESAGACLYTPELEDMCGGADRNSIYENLMGADEDVTPTYVGCFVDASSDDYLEMFGDTFQDQGASFTGGVEAGFGLTFDGEGDYAMLTRTEGYTADGTFTIAFWFTKTTCNDPEQPYEMLYSHMNSEGDFRSPHIFIQLGCAHSDVHSTAGNGDIIRIAMGDDDSRKYLWDTPLSDAAGGGFVTSMWIHFALAMDNRGARVYLDGVDVSEDFGFPEPTNRWVEFAQTYENLAWPDPTSFHPGTVPGPLGYRGMAGKRMSLPSGLNITTAVATCSAFCLSTDGGSFQFMGLQWQDECYCDNQYDGRGLGQADASDCGVTDAHPMPVCGTSEQTEECGYRNAVFNTTDMSSYLGCWMDGPQWEPTDEQWGGMTMTMDAAYGDGGDDAGEYWENVTLPIGSGSQGGAHYALHKMGTSSGWAEGTYIEVWQDVVAASGTGASCEPREGIDSCEPPSAGACGGGQSELAPFCTPEFIGRIPPCTVVPDCTYNPGSGDVPGGLTLLTAGGYTAATCTGPDGCADVDINQRWGNEDRCTDADLDEDGEADGCVYTAATCPDGCLDEHEDDWVGFDVLSDGNQVGEVDLKVKIVTTQWGNGVSWEITNMDLSWARGRGGFERRETLASGPVRGHPTLGSTGGKGWYSHQEYTGSIGSVGIYWRPLDQEQISCLYSKTANILTVCVPPEEMTGWPFYTTMNPHDLSGDVRDFDYDDSTVDQCAEYCNDYAYFGLEWGGRCSCGNTYGAYGQVDDSECDIECGGDPGDPGHCVFNEQTCSDDYEAEGEGSFCHESETNCQVCGEQSDDATSTWCHPVQKPMCGGRGKNSVYEEMLDGVGWTDWAVPTVNACADSGNDCCANEAAGEPAACAEGYVADASPQSYENCPNYNCVLQDGQEAPQMGAFDCSDSTFGVSTPGVRAQCQCMGSGGIIASTGMERRNDDDPGSWRDGEGGDMLCIGPDGGPGMVRYGTPTFEYKGCYQDRFQDQDGITMYDNTYVDDDYGMTFDGQGDYAEVDMERNGRWLTDDGTFTVAFWVTKTACTVPAWWETVVAYYKYPEMSMWDDRNSHLVVMMGCASFAESSIEGNVMRFNYQDDDGWKAMADFNMDSSLIDGPDTRATDEWVHVVMTFANEDFNVYIDGKDPCPRSRGPPGRNEACPNIGLPEVSRWTPWVRTPCDDSVTDKMCNTIMTGGATTGIDMSYGVCQACEDMEPNSEGYPFSEYPCEDVIPWLLSTETSGRHPWFVPTPESCEPIGHAPAQCLEQQMGFVNGSIVVVNTTALPDDDCCALTGKASCASGYTYIQGPACAGFSTGVYETYCFPDAQAEKAEDCSYTSGEAASCGTGCNYTAAAYENPKQALCSMPLQEIHEDTPGWVTFGTICPLTCEVCEEGGQVDPECDMTNSSSPSVNLGFPAGRAGRNKQSNLFIGGAPNGRFSFTGSINGFGLFRYPLTQQEASCLFRFGEFDIHICPKVEDMNGLMNAMTFLPADPPMTTELPHSDWEDRRVCERALNDCVVPEVKEECAPTAHDAAQCMETPNGSHETHENMMDINGTMYEYDSDCCAMMGTGACAPGYSYVQGTPGCGGDWMAIASTWCVPDTDPLPNCTYTAGDVSSCAAACTYTAPEPQAQAMTVEAPATCENPPPMMAHCAWGVSTCDRPIAGIEGQAAVCHSSEEACAACGQSINTTWCPEAAVDLGVVCELDGDTCPEGCVLTEAVVGGLPVCGDEDATEATCDAAFEDAPGRCYYEADTDMSDGYTPRCYDPMGTPLGRALCVEFCAAVGMPYAGLTGASTCWCGDDEDAIFAGGEASPTECDANHDGIMDCGTFDADRSWWRSQAAGECRQRLAVYRTEGMPDCAPIAHDAAQCLEAPNEYHETHFGMYNVSGTIMENDADCCTVAGAGGCAPGYTYIEGTRGCGAYGLPWVTSTWCVPDTTDPLPDCTFIAGDESSCDTTTCNYRDASGTEVGCYRIATGMPEGLQLGGDAYLDDSGRHSGATSWWSGVGEADDTSYDDFGIHFDGDGDYAQVVGVDNGYAADGTFAISMWVTKPNCMVSGKEEILYKHGDLGGRRGAAIMMMYVCSNDPSHQHSTVQQARGQEGFQKINLVRVYLQDDDQQRAVFDVSIDKDGGYVTDTWVHLVVSVHRDQIKAYVDGRRQYRVGYPVPVPHALNEKRNQWLQVQWGEDPHQKCAEFCTGYTYSGVQNTEYGQQCFCDNDLPSFDTEAHCTWTGDCSSDIVHGVFEPCHASQQMCEGPCSQQTEMTWCPATSGQQQAPESSCGVEGSLCGAAACEDNEWLCTPERLAGSHAMPNGTALTALCDTDMHTLAGIGQWVEAGTLVRGSCPVLCGECTPGADSTDTTPCMDTFAVSELATRANGEVVRLAYIGCFSDDPDAGDEDWMDPETNAAYPSLFDTDMGRFNVDHGYGVGGRNEPPHDYYETVELMTPANASGSAHEFHAHGVERHYISRIDRVVGGWAGGFWEVTSTDGALCSAITENSQCEAAGECSLIVASPATCEPDTSWHVPAQCREPQAGGAVGLDGDCCAMEGRGSCADGYTYVAGGPCGPDNFPIPLVATLCVADGVTAVYDDCSAYDNSDASTCPTPACTYTAESRVCGPTVYATGTPDDAEQFTSLDLTATGSMICAANSGGLRGCTSIPMDQGTDNNRDACAGAIGAVCTFVEGADDTPDTCVAAAVAACAAATDEAACTTASTDTTFGADSTPGCDYTPPNTAVVVHIHTGHWGNYISWEMRDVASGAVEGSGPDSSPIELGGIKGMDTWQWDSPWDAFIGNIADLLIFVRPPSDDDVDCLYRAQQANLGKCRAPDGIWGMSFWDTLTNAEWSQEQEKMVSGNPSLNLWGEASIRDTVGLDLTANNQPMAMRGEYYLMDGVFQPWDSNVTNPGLTPEACVAQCTADGYAYAGLMSGNQCVCDNSYDLYGEHVPTPFEVTAGSDGCTVGNTGGCQPTCTCIISTPPTDVNPATCAAAGPDCTFNRPDWSCGGRECVGDSDGNCGGGFKLAVYDTSSSAYVGCYEDHEANSVGFLRLRDGAEDYAKDASFTVSFWFTHNHCENTNATGNWEPLYHHSTEECEDCPKAGVDVFMTCGMPSMVRGEMVQGTFIKVWVQDDDGKMVNIDIPFGEETEGSIDESGGTVTEAWVHFALVVDEDTVAAYIDGTAVTRYGIQPWFMENNLAVGHLNSWEIRRNDGVIELESALSGMTFGDDGAVCINTTFTPADVTCGFDGMSNGTAVPPDGRGMRMDCPDSCKFVSTPGVFLGSYFGAYAPSFFNGYMANLGIARRALPKTEISCMYRYGESHLSRPDSAYNP